MQKVVRNEKVARNTRSCRKVAKQFVESFNYNGRHHLFLSRGKENSNTPLFLQRKFSKTGAEPTACIVSSISNEENTVAKMKVPSYSTCSFLTFFLFPVISVYSCESVLSLWTPCFVPRIPQLYGPVVVPGF